ncbi:MAG: hypothetical protein KZQ73_10925, partial [Candidatus Thiodiazotropha sp. (ex Semelilucina semeliformis)]|nr:hypothetical protein [Candidatus Thiodiazotropha sp. (ex Semelilucina semeliformis)]
MADQSNKVDVTQTAFCFSAFQRIRIAFSAHWEFASLFFVLFFLLYLLHIPLSYAESTDLWQLVQLQQKNSPNQTKAGLTFRVDRFQLAHRLSRAGFEGSSASGDIELPTPGGEIQKFQLLESPIMAPALAARYPDIKTYKVYGIDNPMASGRLSISPKGFAGMVSSSDGTFYIDHEDNDQYRVVRRSRDLSNEPFTCEVKEHHHAPSIEKNLKPTLAMRSAGNLHVYRLAVAATEEFVDAAGGTKADAMSAVTSNINRINQIYERDLGVRLQLVANT